MRAGRRVALASPLLLVLSSISAACSKKPPSSEEQPPSAIAPATPTVPPVAFSGMPVAEFADAAPMEGQSPYAQARAYEASGQYWLARLVLEKKALGSEGTKEEIELLALICHHQDDQSCVDECSARLGRKLKFDAGAPRLPLDATEHKEPDTDFVRARAHLLGHRLKEAREILEPKIIDGKASKEEIRLLKSICKEQGDRMCVALCDAKLK